MAKKMRTMAEKKSTAKERRFNNIKAAVSPEEIQVIPEESEETSQGINKDDFFIVGIGASAGGLEAFDQFFTNMSADSGMAFVLIPHLSPEHKSMMSELLKRYTSMPIFEADNGMQVEPDNVYIIPPDKDMSILNGKLQLIKPAERRGLRHPIDFFFRSLADDIGDHAISIIFSGTGTEGTLGLKNIKGAGGLVLAQDPESARYDGMPRSAIATGLVDYVLPVDKMPEQLLSYIKRTMGRLPPRKQEVEKLKPADVLQNIFVFIRAQTGHDFSLYKHNTVMRRIERRMAVLQVGDLAEYCDYLRNNPREVDTLFRELLIRVTNFFRDPDAYEALKEKALPAIFRNRLHGQPVRIWVPGCSTGEEAYSLAIMLTEYMRELKGNYKLQIFATDVDNGAIEIARNGIYSSNISVDVSPERLTNFFIKKDNSFKVSDVIRESIVFALQNIIKDPPFSKLDMISCRNLLIYLSADLQKKVLPLFRYAMNADGILFLGSSESIGDNNDLFTVLDKRWKIYKARKAEAVDLIPLDLRPSYYHAAAKRERSAEQRGATNVGELTAALLLEHFAPACAVVDRNGDIIYVHGRTGKYLEPAAGKPNLNIIDMAREGLGLGLRTALHQAYKQTKDISVKGLNVRTNGDFQMTDLEVKYLKEPGSLHGLMMVIFQDVSPKTEKTEGAPTVLTPETTDKRVVELELDLKSTREHLQTTIEELETSNEELQATNEELQSSNEELQSTNEELETSKEELQSTNEELMTVNSELQHKMEELSQLNDDMNNLLASTQIATIYLDTELKIKRFTPSATDVINLIQTDIGRPISDIVPKLDYPEMVKDAEYVLECLSAREKEVLQENGRAYLARIRPYRTVANVIDGVVITFVEVTEQRKMQNMAAQLAFARGIVETVRNPLIVLDGVLKVISANKAFYTAFKVTGEDTEGKHIFELGNRQWDIPDLRRLLLEILPRDSRIEDFTVEHDFPDIGHRKMLLNARRIEKTDTILLSIE